MQPDDSLVSVGMADGLLSVQRRKDDKQVAAEHDEKKRRELAMKRRFKFDTQMYSYKPSKVSCAFHACTQLVCVCVCLKSTSVVDYLSNSPSVL